MKVRRAIMEECGVFWDSIWPKATAGRQS